MSGYQKLLQTPGQLKLLTKTVENKRVWDLGCGAGHLTHLIYTMGAAVEGIDKEHGFIPGWHQIYQDRLGEGLDFTRAYFEHWTPLFQADIAVVSWPLNRLLYGLVPLLESVQQVVYLGLNDGATQCGGPDFWRHVFHRALDVSCAGEQQQMLVYGKQLDYLRPWVNQEEKQASKDWRIHDEIAALP